MTAEQLGFTAITHTSDLHRIAAVAELVRRLQPAALQSLLNSLPVEPKPVTKRSKSTVTTSEENVTHDTG